MDIIQIINKKREKQELTKEEITYAVEGFTFGQIPDYQMSALLMAICLNGMTNEETFALTDAMMKSGVTLSYPESFGIMVDKHSTGGVSDTTTLPLIAILACAGLKSVKMSGAGLGFTGGTYDKMMTFPGIDLSYKYSKNESQIKKLGAMYCTQSHNIAPADKRIYNLRDVSGTVESIPLIASSIMSKKLACNCDLIMLDVKTGNGAFMQDIESSSTLAKLMIKIGKNAGKKMGAIISDMNQPLGCGIGCALEIKDAIGVLKGEKSRLADLVKILARSIMLLSKKFTIKNVDETIENIIISGDGLERFKQIVKAQKGDISILDKLENEYTPTYKVYAKKEGFIHSYNTSGLGYLVCDMGGGRKEENDTIDHFCGIYVNKKIGDAVHKGDTLFEIYLGKKLTRSEVNSRLADLYKISKTKPKVPPLVYEYI